VKIPGLYCSCHIVFLKSLTGKKNTLHTLDARGVVA
jgi:hypothetical protein